MTTRETSRKIQDKQKNNEVCQLTAPTIILMISAFLKKHSSINWALTDQAMVSGVNFFTSILLARFLGLSAFGVFTLAWMVVLFVNSIQFALVSSPMMTIGPKQADDEQPAYYGAVLVQQFIFSLSSSVLLLAGIAASALLFPEWGIEPLIWPLATVSWTFQMQDFMRRYFFTRGRYPIAFINDSISYLGQLALLAWLTHTATLTSASVLWAMALTSFLAMVHGALHFSRIQIVSAICSATIHRHWHFSKWLTASALLQWLSGNLFNVAAGSVLGAAAVGALRAVQNIVSINHILFQGLENIVPSQASRHFSSGGAPALSRYLITVTVSAAVPVFAILGLALASPKFWLNLVYGAEYVAFGFVMKWYAGVYVFMLFALPLRCGLRAIENTRPIFRAYLFMSVFSTFCAIPAAKYLGLQGVVAGIMITYIILVLITGCSLVTFIRREYHASVGRAAC